MFLYTGEQKPELFRSVQLSSRTIQQESECSKLPNVSKDIQQNIVKALRSYSGLFKGRENLIIRYNPSYNVEIH